MLSVVAVVKANPLEDAATKARPTIAPDVKAAAGTLLSADKNPDTVARIEENPSTDPNAAIVAEMLTFAVALPEAFPDPFSNELEDIVATAVAAPDTLPINTPRPTIAPAIEEKAANEV